MAYPTIEEIKASLSGLDSKKDANPFDKHLPKYNTYGEDPAALQVIKHDVPTDAIYDQLSDGSYVARYENYLGATGNEDRLAKQQTWYEQAGYGLLKNATKVGTYALDATVGTIYGLGNALFSGGSIWENDFSNQIDDWNKQLDYALPNYYSAEEKAKGFLSSNLLSSNFWFNDVAGGVAFVGGAILPEIAIGALSGGTTLAGSAAKVGFNLTGKLGKLGKAVNKLDDVMNYSKGRQMIRDSYRAQLGEGLGNVASTSAFLLRTSNFEAGMEARHNFRDAVSTYMSTYEDKNGRPPTTEELMGFTEQARKAANGVYATNLAILSVSNAAMFGQKFNVKTPQFSKELKNWGNSLIGLGTEAKMIDNVLTTTLKPATKLQKFTGNTYKILSKPAIEGLYEEGFQGVAGKTMQNYLESKYDPKAVDGYSLAASVYDAFGEQYGTKEGWKEMGIGMIIGFAGGAMQGQGFEGLGKNSRKSAQTQIEKDLEVVNSGVTSLRNMNRASSIRNFRNIADSKADNYESTSVENSIMNVEFIQTQEHIKSPTEIKKDFDTIIDNMELDQEAMDVLEASGADVNTYRQSLKNEFKEDVDAYNFAKRTVSALGLDKTLKETQGNLSEVRDTLTMTIMLGKKSEASAKNIGNQVDSLIGTTGMFDYMQHYSELSEDKKTRIEELKNKRQVLEEARQAAKTLGLKIANISPRKTTEKQTTQTEYEKTAEKLTIAQTRVSELESEINNLSDAVKEDFKATGFQFGTSSLIENSDVSVDDLVENLNKLDTYITSLNKAGKKYEADSLEYLVKQFKMFSDANTQMVKTVQQMRATNFFSTKKGKEMVKAIVGDKYSISEEFKKEIEDNNEYIRQSIANFNNLDSESIDALQAIRNSIEENPNLSEREKFKLTSILRLQVGVQSIVDRVEDILNVTTTFSSDKEITPSPLEGDTIVIRQVEEIKLRNIDNLDILNQTINEIAGQIDEIINRTKERAVKSSRLKQEKESLERETTAQAVKKQLEDQLQAERESEFSTPETIAELEQQIANIKIEDRSKEVAEIDEKLETTDAPYQIIGSTEYKRLNELYKKKEKGISEKEQEELEELEADIDQWLMITGTIAGGLRLSDLIQQKVTLEQTPVLLVENIEVVESKDTEEIFTDKSLNNHYDMGLTYDAVTATKDPKTGLIEVAGINAIDLTIEVGFPFEFKSDPEKKTTLISEDEVKRINESSNVKILPTNKDLTTSYSVVTTLIKGMDGQAKRVPLKSRFSEEYAESMNIPSVYGLEQGDSLTLEIDANDDYNKQLLDEYQEKVGIPNMTEEQEESLVESRYENLLQIDKTYNDKKEEIIKVEKELTNKKLTDRAKAQKNKKLVTLNTQVNKREDALRNKAEKEIDRIKGKKVTDKKIQEELDILARSLVIKQKDKDGNFVSVFKRIRTSGSKGVIGEAFEGLRYQIILTQDFVGRLITTRGKETFDIGLKVKHVFLGHPTYNFTEDGTGVIFKRVSEQESKKIVDIGFVQNGKIQTKTRQKGIDQSFLVKHKQNKKASKVPFIVVEVGGKRIAYPVKTITQEKPSVDEFQQIFNSNAMNPEKAQALNRFMASMGVDIKQPGNAFLAMGENNNLTQEFFNEKLAQLENIEYFYNLDAWISQDANVEKIAQDQILVDIDVINPFHSPKIQMDFSDVKIDPLFRQSAEVSEDEAADINDESLQKLAEDTRKEKC